jgi:hypothetical protein
MLNTIEKEIKALKENEWCVKSKKQLKTK